MNVMLVAVHDVQKIDVLFIYLAYLNFMIIMYLEVNNEPSWDWKFMLVQKMKCWAQSLLKTDLCRVKMYWNLIFKNSQFVLLGPKWDLIVGVG